MATTAHAANFYTFVTAHSSFELTAIVLSGAAGLRLGWGLVDTQGQSRLSSSRREAANSLAGGGRGGRALCAGRDGRRVCLGIVVALLGQSRRCHFQRGRDHRVPGPGGTRAEKAERAAATLGHDRDRSGWRDDRRGKDHDHGLNPRPFRYRPGCSAPAVISRHLQDRADLERRHEPRAEELRAGV